MDDDPALEPFELPPDLAEDAALSRHAGPTNAARLRLRATLGPAPGGPPGGSGAHAPPSSAAPAGAPWTWLAAASVLLLVVGGGLGLARLGRPREAAREVSHVSSDATPAPTATAASTEPFGSTGRAGAAEAETTPADGGGPREAAPRDPSPPERTGPASRPRRDLREMPGEVALLEAAREALARRPAEALRACERHRRLYPEGLFAEEREALATEALARSGRRTEAVRRFDAFRARFAQSPHRTHLEQILAGSAERGEN